MAVVTGGSRGIGLQMAEALGEMGARVAITARKQDELDAARAHLEGLGVECLTVAARPRAIRRRSRPIVDAVLARWGQIDILVNNAGCNWAAPAEDYPDDGWRKVMDLNVDAQFFLTREVGAALDDPAPQRQDRQHRVDRRASSATRPNWGMRHDRVQHEQGRARQPDARARRRMGPYNINVNAICPGFFPSKMTKATLERIDATCSS